MINMKQIHEFAMKWFNKFMDPKTNYLELVDQEMGDDCKELGFKNECYDEVYYEELEEIVNYIDDIYLLGSAVYSRWYYFSQCADGEDILKFEDRTWFIKVLNRMAYISKEDFSLFKGTLKKIRIVSNNMTYGPMPSTGRDVKQLLTINDKGRVWFTEYNFIDEKERFEKVGSNNFKINKADVDTIFKVFEGFFKNEYSQECFTDAGNWDMELTNTDGEVFKYSGPLCTDLEYEDIFLSDLVRNTLGMNCLYVFDGDCIPDAIAKIKLHYKRVKVMQIVQDFLDEEEEKIAYHYDEHLIIDRESETIEHIQNVADNTKVTRKYEVEDGVIDLLNSFEGNDLFSNIPGDPDDAIDTPDDKKDYVLVVEYESGRTKTISGSYDRNGLPDDFAHFISTVFEFIMFYGLGEVFNPYHYNRPKRRESDYMYCSVIFEEEGDSYYYISDDDNIEVGDFVLVPAGKDNNETVVEVVEIEYFSEEDVPLPIEKTKHIIRKCTEDDLDYSVLN